MGAWTATLPPPRYFDETLWGRDTWAMLSASYTGDLATIAGMLDEAPARIRAQFAYYEPLHYAVRGGHFDAVVLLLERGAHPKAEGWGGRLGDDTPLAKAIDREREDLRARLLEAAETLPPYAPPSETPRTPERQLELDLALASGDDDRGRVQEIIAARPELATRIALYEAVHHGQTDLVRWLMAAGADPNGHMPWACWFTPLMHALRYARPRWEIAGLLLDRGVPVDSTNGLGMTALHIVVLHGTTEAAVWLLEHGAGIDAIDGEFCSTPLGWAARWGRTDMAALLLERGADPALPAEHDWARPARWAAKKGHPDVAALL